MIQSNMIKKKKLNRVDALEESNDDKMEVALWNDDLPSVEIDAPSDEYEYDDYQPQEK